MADNLTPAQQSRLLRAKAHELEHIVLHAEPFYSALDAAADIALVAALLADTIERLDVDDT